MGFNCRPLERERSRLDRQPLISLLLYPAQKCLQPGICGILSQLNYSHLISDALVNSGTPSSGNALPVNLQPTHLASDRQLPRLLAVYRLYLIGVAQVNYPICFFNRLVGSHG
mgnify:CR=1 FL=1